MFGRLAVLRDGVGSGVSVLACSGLASGGYVSVVVEEALSHVGSELVDAALLDVPKPVFNFFCDVFTLFFENKRVGVW